jgi:hypothetical protein
MKHSRREYPGVIYFFKCVTAPYYKVGSAKLWKQRRKVYSGPIAIEKLFFVRKVQDRFVSETMFKMFLEGIGYLPVHGRTGRKNTDWFRLA